MTFLLGAEEGRPSNWLSADSSRRRMASLPKQKSPAGNDPAAAKDPMVRSFTELATYAS